MMIESWVGFLLPPIIDVLNKYVGSSQIRFWVSIAICLVVAVGLNIDAVFNGDYGTILSRTALIFSEAQIIYKSYWGGSYVRERLSLKS